MIKNQSLDKSRNELKAMQLEALITATKDFLTTCDSSIEPEALEQLITFQEDLREIEKVLNQ